MRRSDCSSSSGGIGLPCICNELEQALECVLIVALFGNNQAYRPFLEIGRDFLALDLQQLEQALERVLIVGLFGNDEAYRALLEIRGDIEVLGSHRHEERLQFLLAGLLGRNSAHGGDPIFDVVVQLGSVVQCHRLRYAARVWLSSVTASDFERRFCALAPSKASSAVCQMAFGRGALDRGLCKRVPSLCRMPP